MQIVTVIQARRGSTRLPDKIFLPLAGEPLLVRMVERVLRARNVGTVVVATTRDAEDEAVETLCRERGFNVYRGDTHDLLDRHYQAGLAFGAEAVVKIPSDCPLIDPKVIDKTINAFLVGTFDYVGNLHPQSYPDGNDVEVMRFDALTRAHKEASRPLEREHTTPYFWENPSLFKIGNVGWETGQDLSLSHRFTIDYPADYAFIAAVYDALYEKKPDFTLEDILDLLEKRPDIYALNAEYAGVNWYRNHLDELKTVRPDETRKAPNE